MPLHGAQPLLWLTLPAVCKLNTVPSLRSWLGITSGSVSPLTAPNERHMVCKVIIGPLGHIPSDIIGCAIGTRWVPSWQSLITPSDYL